MRNGDQNHNTTHTGIPTAPVTTRDDGKLFEKMMVRYMKSQFVQDFLFDRYEKNGHPSNFSKSFSYACVYYPSAANSSSSTSHQLPTPFLDVGDFLIYHHVDSSIALGTINNLHETHTLTSIRDAACRNISPQPILSTKPRVRNFAIDLDAPGMELLEFSWMQDDSLIVACRRLYHSPHAPHKPHVLSADLLFFPVLSELHTLLSVVPLFRVLLNETPALCQFCGSVGVSVCRCHPSCKIRAPFDSVDIGVDYDPDQDPDNLNNFYTGVSVSNYSSRIANLNHSGAFFAQWYKRSAGGTKLVPTITPRHPVPYRFITGNKTDTLRLITLYLQKISFSKSSAANELRLNSPPAATDATEKHQYHHKKDGALVHYATGNTSSRATPLPTSQEVNEDQVYQSSSSGSSEEPNKSNTGEIEQHTKLTSGNTRNVSAYNTYINKKDRLKEFMSMHVRDIRCLPCEKTFSKRSNLVRHIETKHFELKPFECDKCNRKFGHSNHLRRHIAKLHVNINNHQQTTLTSAAPTTSVPIRSRTLPAN